MGSKKIFIVDDYEESCQLLTEILGSTYQCYSTSNSKSAPSMIAEVQPHLVLLDFRMPELMGVDVCRAIRTNPLTSKIPVVFMAGSETVEDRIQAYEAGANDFISKPYHVKELLLRIKVRLCESGVGLESGSQLKIANLRMDTLSRQVFIDEDEVFLSQKQFEILRLLVTAGCNVVTREACLRQIWGESEVTSRNVDSQINYLKRKINAFRGRIIAVPSLGYRIDLSSDCRQAASSS